MAADAPAMSDADEAMAAAIDRAAELAAPAPAAGDFIRLIEAAAIADVTEQWLRLMVKSGKVRGVKVGRNWQVSRSDVEWFQRHPTMGRPRREAAPF
jgi:excisionase family DNA binding protein